MVMVDTDGRWWTRTMGMLSEASACIDDSPPLSAMEIRAKGRKLKVERGLGPMVVGYTS
jgi:replicative DNA helicase